MSFSRSYLYQTSDTCLIYFDRSPFILVRVDKSFTEILSFRWNALHKKWNFLFRVFTVNMTKSAQFPADLVTFTKEILNGKLHFLRSNRIRKREKNRLNLNHPWTYLQFHFRLLKPIFRLMKWFGQWVESPNLRSLSVTETFLKFAIVDVLP